jgi:hypothetical protein
VWLLHHPARGKRADGQTGRGSIALPGFVDVVMELNTVRRARSRDRRRRICAFSRYSATPRHLIIELNADGTDYTVRTDSAGVPLVQTWPAIEHMLTETTDKLTLQRILECWDIAEQGAPDRSTLSRWLKRATDQGLVRRSGTGYKTDPYVYWLPGREPLLYPGHDASREEQEAWRERIAAHYRSLREETGAA